MRARWGAPLALALARARRHPGRWLLPAVGIALAVGLVAAILGEGTIAGDQAARRALRALPPSERTVRLTWSGGLTDAEASRGRRLLASLAPGTPTRVVTLRPTRIDRAIVQLVAIEPLAPWARGALPRGACTTARCEVAQLGGTPLAAAPRDRGIALALAGRGRLTSAVPLGYVPPLAARGSVLQGVAPPLLVTGDARGLERLPALSGSYRTNTWVAPLDVGALHAWDLRAERRRFTRAGAGLTAEGYTLGAPGNALASADRRAQLAPRRLLVAAGGALAALVGFVVLAAGALRPDMTDELRRLRAQGATRPQRSVVAVAESAWLMAVGVTAGALLGVAATALLAAHAGEPAGEVLRHSLVRPGVVLGAAGLWLAMTAVLSALLLAGGEGASRLGDALAVGAAVGLAIALTREASGDDPLPLLLAPLACLAAGVIVVRLAGPVLRGGERLARRGALPVRLALLNLARAPGPAALAVAFLAVSTGLGGFALAYRATLNRQAADQAADRVPLDFTVAAGPQFVGPLALAPPARWRELASGPVLAVRRGLASVPRGAGSVTVPLLGVPAGGLKLIHGWRESDGSAPRAALARRLTVRGPVRTPGPRLRAGALTLRARSRGDRLRVDAIVGRAGGIAQRVALGTAGPRTATLRARVPAGELLGLELRVPEGVELLAGHQSAESLAAGQRTDARVELGPLRTGGATVPLEHWVARGGAQAIRGGVVRFSSGGEAGLVRPPQPADDRVVPVLADAQTAASTARGGGLPLDADGVRVRARVVGTLKRFPTLSGQFGGFVVADESALAAALDAEIPGRGVADELWMASNGRRLLPALRRGDLASLRVSSREALEQRARREPVARAVLGALLASAIAAALLAAVGLLVALLGASRDRRTEADLAALGLGPRALRADLRLRALAVAAAGVVAGIALAAGLTRLAVGAVRAGAGLSAPRPPVVTVVPWGGLLAWAALVLAALLAAAWIASLRRAP